MGYLWWWVDTVEEKGTRNYCTTLPQAASGQSRHQRAREETVCSRAEPEVCVQPASTCHCRHVNRRWHGQEKIPQKRRTLRQVCRVYGRAADHGRHGTGSSCSETSGRRETGRTVQPPHPGCNCLWLNNLKIKRENRRILYKLF